MSGLIVLSSEAPSFRISAATSAWRRDCLLDSTLKSLR